MGPEMSFGKSLFKPLRCSIEALSETPRTLDNPPHDSPPTTYNLLIAIPP